MKTQFLLLLLSALMLPSSLSIAAAEKDLAEYAEMSPEHCAEFPPTVLYERLMTADSHVPGISSEAGHDYFCSVYQRQLQKFVDAKYPRAREYRKPLTDAFLSMVNYIEVIYYYNAIKHLYERTAADAEWIIYQGEKDNYKLWRDTGYDSVAIERLALIMADGSGRGTQFERQALPHLRRALQDFIEATTDEENSAIFTRRPYFAHALIKFMTDLI